MTQLKVVLLGDSFSGKTSIIKRAMDDSFDETMQATIGGTSFHKVLEVDGQSYQLNIWDTAGHEKYRSIGNLFYRNFDIALLVYSVDNIKSLEDINFWYNQLMTGVPEKDRGVIFLIGNKIDLDNSLTRSSAERSAEIKGIPFMEVSAKTGQGISTLFVCALNEYLKSPKSQEKIEAIKLDEQYSNGWGSCFINPLKNLYHYFF